MTDVFISYAREDHGFVQRLHDALASAGRQSWVDWEGIPASAKWMAEVRAAIDEANCFCFVVSPDSVESPVCREEAAHAAASNKRILPLLHRAVDDGLVPETVAAHNWIEFDHDQDFDQAFATLVKALETEPEHLRTHTRLLVKAKEWDGSKDRSLLLHGSDLTGAETWLGSAQGKEPAPTQLHTAYVLASRKAASRRQRTTIGAVAIALILSLVLATVAVFQRSEAQDAQARAEEQRAVADARATESRSRELGAQSLLQVDQDPELALLLAIEAAEIAQTGTAETALRTALGASHVESTTQEEGGVGELVLSEDGSMLVTGGQERGEATGGAWLAFRTSDDLAQARTVSGLSDHAGEIRDLAVDPQGRVAALSNDYGSLVILDARAATVLLDVFVPVLLGHAELAFSPDGEQLLVAGEEGVAWVDVGTGEQGAPLEVPSPSSGWNDAAVDPTGRWAALGGGTNTYLIDTGSGDAVTLGDGAARSLAFDASGGRLASAVGGSVLLWDVETGEELRRLEARGVNAVALSPDGATLLTGSADGSGALWNVATGSRTASFVGHDGAIVGVAYDPSGARAYTASRDGTTRVWRVPSAASPITSAPVLAVSGDGRVFATADGAGVAFLDALDGRTVSSIRPGDLGLPSACLDAASAPAVRLDRAGALAVAVFGERCLAAIDVASGGSRWVVDLGTEEGATAQPDPEVWVAPDGTSVLVAQYVSAGALAAELRLLDAATGDERWSEITGDASVYGADFAGDGRSAFVAGRYGLLGAALYDLDRATSVCPVQAVDRVNDVAGIPDGGFALATAAGVQVVDGACADVDVGELTERQAPALAIAYRPDGLVAATVGTDATIRFWDVASGAALGSAPGGAEQIAFDEEGSLLVAGADGAFRVTCEQCAAFDELLTLARERVTRALTPEERATYLGEA
jgi:WD40 repeat protein